MKVKLIKMENPPEILTCSNCHGAFFISSELQKKVWAHVGRPMLTHIWYKDQLKCCEKPDYKWAKVYEVIEEPVGGTNEQNQG